MRCLMLKIFAVFRKIFFHRTTSNSKMTAVRGNALKVVQSYLSNKKQYTQGENNKSSLNWIISGVPQGSILGPLFF